MSDFSSLGLEPRLLKALAAEGYTTPTPIQLQAIPHVLAGKDLLGIAQTGTGKTASFALPILQFLAGHKRAPAPKSARVLVLSPTRELTAQIADSFRTYGRYLNETVTEIFGGVGEHQQIKTMAKGIDVLVATPGRLLDLTSRHTVDLSKVEIFVLDEADRMLDMGFIRDIKRLVTYLPRQRQNLFFSATMPSEIGSLASDLLKDPVSVSVTPQATTVERIQQRVIHVDNADKRALLIELLRKHDDMNRTLVFTRTKHGADKVVRALAAAGIVASAIHSNKSQSQRVSTMNAFRAGRSRVLVATDIAARGIDVDGISHVINYDLPHVAESYVHRIGRTARAGADGIAIAFCDREERSLLRDIEKLTRQTIPSSEWKAPRETGVADTYAPLDQHQPREERRHESRRPARHDGSPRPHGKPQRPHGKGPRPHGQAQSSKPQHERAAGAHPGKPHGQAQAHAKPHHERTAAAHAGKPHGQAHPKPHHERPAEGHAAHGLKPFKGPKPHRKGGSQRRPHGGAQGAASHEAGGNALPRFLTRRR